MTWSSSIHRLWKCHRHCSSLQILRRSSDHPRLRRDQLPLRQEGKGSAGDDRVQDPRLRTEQGRDERQGILWQILWQVLREVLWEVLWELWDGRIRIIQNKKYK